MKEPPIVCISAWRDDLGEGQTFCFADESPDGWGVYVRNREDIPELDFDTYEEAADYAEKLAVAGDWEIREYS